MGRAGALLGLVLAVAMATPAGAATMGQNAGSAVTYNAGTGEANRLTLTEDANAIVFEDLGATITVGNSGCTSVDAHHARCPETYSRRVLIDLGDGDDTATLDAPNFCLGRNADCLNIDGGTGNDDLTGHLLSERLIGGDGNDRLVGGTGHDVLDPGPGTDTVDGAGGADDMVTYLVPYGSERTNLGGRPDAGVTVVLDGGPVSGHVGEGDAISGVEGAEGTGGPDVLVGTDGPNLLNGVTGDDRLEGRGGDDHLDGRGGADSMDGGAGDDFLSGDDLAYTGSFPPSQEAARDDMHCGDGNDSAGGQDIDAIDDDCERINGGANTGWRARCDAGQHRAGDPPCPTAPPGPTGLPVGLPVGVAGTIARPLLHDPRRALRVRRGRVRITVGCPRERPIDCNGTLALATPGGASVLASAQLALGAGESRTLKLKLRRAALRRLRKHRRVRAVALYAVPDAQVAIGVVLARPA
jgi:hypothetical protein